MSKLAICHTEGILEAGLDESGRGPLISRIYAAAVIWPAEFDKHTLKSPEYNLLKDSKKLTEIRRYLLRPFIEAVAIDYAVAYIDEEEIDRIGIGPANKAVFHKAIDQLSISPQSLIVDGTQFDDYYDQDGELIPHTTVVKGDNSYQSIAAASVLAKCYHDDHIQKIHKEFPMYGWNTNHGYGSKAHYAALKEHGACKYHRRSFNLHIPINLIDSDESDFSSDESD